VASPLKIQLVSLAFPRNPRHVPPAQLPMPPQTPLIPNEKAAPLDGMPETYFLLKLVEI
jgi:hypothetical protein